MPHRTFFKLVNKAFRFTVLRSLQRFNIYNRAKKFLGPDAKYFMPAPRALGAMSQLTGAPPQYPHLEGGGFRSIEQKRIAALEQRRLKLLEPKDQQADVERLKNFSETETDDNLVISASTNRNLEVNKTVTVIGPSKEQLKLGTDEHDTEDMVPVKNKQDRPLPKCTNLPLQNIADIWNTDRTPVGRLSIMSLQELMINKLADSDYWTSAKISEKYKIKEEYADDITKHVKQIRIVVSPRMGKLLDYTGRENPIYQASKHIVYHIDKRLRNDIDKKYDDMYLPDDNLDEEVRQVIEPPIQNLPQTKPKERRIVTAKPLRISPVNKSDAQIGLEKTKKLALPQNLDSIEERNSLKLTQKD